MSIGFEYMNGHDIQDIIYFLNENICPYMPIEDCKTRVATYWPKISEKIFSNAAAPYICGPDFVGACSERPPPQ